MAGLPLSRAVGMHLWDMDSVENRDQKLLETETPVSTMGPVVVEITRLARIRPVVPAQAVWSSCGPIPDLQ